MINIEHAEYDAYHAENFVFDVPEGHDRWLLLITRTAAEFFLNGMFKEYPANTAVLFEPGQKILYRACRPTYGNDWIRFKTDEPYILNTALPRGKPFAVNDCPYCHKLFQLIAAEHRLNNSFKDITIDQLLKVLFHKLLESYHCSPVNSLYQGLQELKTKIYRSPHEDWSIQRMADELNISRGYLESIYKSTFGITCMDDVIKSRIELAKKYLMNDYYTITEIVSLCGYRNAEHFYRQFKKMTGFTPKTFRKMPVGKNIAGTIRQGM